MRNPFRRAEPYDQDKEEDNEGELRTSVSEPLDEAATAQSISTPTSVTATPEPAVDVVPESLHSPRERVNLSISETRSSESAGRLHRENAAKIRSLEIPHVGEGSKFATGDWWDVSHGKRWQKLPSSGLSSDVVCDAGTVGDVAVCAASVRGWKHQVLGSQNEDAFYIASAEDATSNPYVVVVVADGLSSAKHSGYSARRSTQAIGRLLAKRISQIDQVDSILISEHLDQILSGVASEILQYHSTDYGAPEEHHAEIQHHDVFITLTVAVISASLSDGGKRQAFVGAIGDSPLFIMNSSGWEKLTAESANEEIVDTQTQAFPAETVCPMRQISIDADDVVVVATDGVGNFINDGKNTLALGAILQEKWLRPVDVLSFLSHVSFNLKGADDDRTAVAVWSAVEMGQPQ